MEENNSQLPSVAASSEPSQIPYAGFTSRYAASALDSFITGLISIGVAIVLVLASFVVEGFRNSLLINLLSAIATWGYFVYLTKRYRATWGKKFFKLKVESVDGAEMTWGKAIIREVLGKFVSAIVLGIGYIWFFFDKRKQTWHDKFAKTVVVQVEPLTGKRKVLAFILSYGVIILAILALLGVLAVVALTAINPTEQLERAREAQQQSEQLQMETQQKIDEMNLQYETVPAESEEVPDINE